MPWETVKSFVPCCDEIKRLMRNLPYYTVKMTTEGLRVEYWNDYENNRIFKFCPFCGQKLTDGV
jgi:hypothetical protein